MKARTPLVALTAGLLFSPAVLAQIPVPEIDGGSAVMALGLTVAVVALIRDRIRR